MSQIDLAEMRRLGQGAKPFSIRCAQFLLYILCLLPGMGKVQIFPKHSLFVAHKPFWIPIPETPSPSSNSFLFSIFPLC